MAGATPGSEVEGVREASGVEAGPLVRLPPEEGDLVHRLKEQKANLAQQKKALTKQLRNEQKKRQRLRERAKKLSNEDLVRVLCAREAQAKAKAKAKSRSV